MVQKLKNTLARVESFHVSATVLRNPVDTVGTLKGQKTYQSGQKNLIVSFILEELS